VRVERVLELLLWYGFIGITRENGDVTYIYDVMYDIRRLKALVNKRLSEGAKFRINPAFWKGLETKI